MLVDPRDAVLYAACPLLMAPTLGALPALAQGKRLVAGADGVYLEARSPALHWCLRVSNLPMPYGPVREFLTLANGPMPRALLHEIVRRSLVASPNEIAFGIEARSQGYALIDPPGQKASPGHVTYADAFDPDALVLDVHSHGEGSAFFSGTDDASDLSRIGPYLAAVVAPRRTPADTRVCLRAVAAPYLLPLDESPLIQGLFQ